MLGDYSTHRRLVRDLVVESEVAAVFVDYTPSPEAKYPQAVDEIYAAVKWVAENDAELDLDRRRMALVGNSAGGNMALAAALLAKETTCARRSGAGVAVARDDAPHSDWKSYALYGGERFLTAPLMKWMFDRYTTDARAREEILLSPVNASREELFGLPPTLIAVAENDILRDEGEAMGRRLDEAGVETDDRALQRRHPRLGNAQRLRAVGSHPRPDPLCGGSAPASSALTVPFPTIRPCRNRSRQGRIAFMTEPASASVPVDAVQREGIGPQRNGPAGADMRGHYPDALLRIVDDFTIAAVNLDPAGIALREGGELRRIVQIVDLHLYAREAFHPKRYAGNPAFRPAAKAGCICAQR